PGHQKMAGLFHALKICAHGGSAGNNRTRSPRRPLNRKCFDLKLLSRSTVFCVSYEARRFKKTTWNQSTTKIADLLFSRFRKLGDPPSR
ncbi:MAG: hypothetical protein WBP63_10910, partial [Silvibacterium sp.]